MTSIPSFVIFNVAGQRFTTSSQTLLKEPSSRLALLARGVLPSIKDDTGAIFLDRDSHHFQLLLNYMRDSWCSLPASAQERRELLQEARWYQVCVLLLPLDRNLDVVMHKHTSITLFIVLLC